MQLSPYIRFATDQHLDFSWKLPKRIIFDYELLYIKEGDVLITINDTIYNAHAGDVFLFRPNKPHSMQPLSSSGIRQPHIHFDLIWQEDSENVFISFKTLAQMNEAERSMIRQDILLNSSIDLPDKLRITDMNTFEQLLSDVILEFESQLPYAQISAQGAFLYLWSFILRQHLSYNNQQISPQNALMLSIRHFLNRYTSQSISLDDLSYRFNISKFYLNRSFKEVFGMSPIHYHQYCRMEKAKNMVLYTSLSIGQIADELGFENLSTFSRAFKHRYSQSPSEVRREFITSFSQ